MIYILYIYVYWDIYIISFMSSYSLYLFPVFIIWFNRSKLLKIKIKLHSDLVCTRGIHSLNSISSFFQQPFENSGFVELIDFKDAPSKSKTSAIIHLSCCKVSHQIQMVIQRFYYRKNFLSLGKINLILSNEEQLKDFKASFLQNFLLEKTKVFQVPFHGTFVS